jgi:hypothetical protein
MSHAADTSDFEAFYGKELNKPYIEEWVFFVLESPGGQYHNGDPQRYEGVEKRPPNKAYYGLPDDNDHWPESLDEVLGKTNAYGPYFAYLIRRFRLKNAYFTNAVKCGLTINGSNPPQFRSYSHRRDPDKRIRDECLNLFLRKELDVKPALVFAMGDNTTGLLRTACPPITPQPIGLYHPNPRIRSRRRHYLERNDSEIGAALATLTHAGQSDGG